MPARLTLEHDLSRRVRGAFPPSTGRKILSLMFRIAGAW